MSPNEQRLAELCSIRRPLTVEELEEAARRAALSRWNVKRKARYWADEDYRRNENERLREYRKRRCR